jgi:hypothetical protein
MRRITRIRSTRGGSGAAGEGHRSGGLVAWALVAATVAVDSGGVVLGVLDRSVVSLVPTCLITATSVAFCVLGGLIVWRQLGHAIGWLFVGMALFLSVCHVLAQNYAVYAIVVDPGSLPFGRVAYWLSSTALDTLFVVLMTLLLLLFPDGRPLTPRWRWAVAAAVVGFIGSLGHAATNFSSSPPLDGIPNPLLATGAWGTLANAAQHVGLPLTGGAAVAGTVSVVLRFRRSTGMERQQMKWIAAGVVGVMAVFLVTLGLSTVGIGSGGGATFALAIVLFPVLMALAILRYRLYDIDLVIRRTITYACLIAILAGLYLGGIATTSWLARTAAGQSSALAVTLSTLTVALAFQPLRRRIQHAVDRRFSRRTVTVEAAIDSFSGVLRTQIDLEALRRELLGVVDQTLQPRHTSLWLRESD